MNAVRGVSPFGLVKYALPSDAEEVPEILSLPFSKNDRDTKILAVISEQAEINRRTVAQQCLWMLQEAVDIPNARLKNIS